MKMLIVEDDKRLGLTLCDLLSGHGYEPELIENGKDGLQNALTGMYDIIILDVMLPGMNGFEVIKQIRTEKISTPILMLTAKDEWQDKIKGLDFGADDYLTKPFIPEELLARLRAISRRKGEVIINSLTMGNLTLNLSLNQMECGGKNIRLGAKEFEIMKYLLTNQNQIVTKESLIVNVWSYDADVEDNNVEVYISFLRKKLQFLKANVKISTVRKVGYLLELL